MAVALQVEAAQRRPGVDFLVVLAAGEATRCPACGAAAWTCWAEVENPEVVEGVVVNCEIEAGLQCQDCKHCWIEVQP